ncbi:PLC-like phosphodiesterase [Chytridium lagenaria]|nr:PLC-like phosphodiesterase [Chytridium lagenaria]
MASMPSSDPPPIAECLAPSACRSLSSSTAVLLKSTACDSMLGLGHTTTSITDVSDSITSHSLPPSPGSSPSLRSLPSPDLENLLPTPPPLSGRESPANVEAIQHILIRGTRMLKYPNKASSRPEERIIKVSLLPLQVSWESKKKKPTLSTADVHAIREIRLGQNTKAFEIHGKAPGIDDRAFTVIYVAGGKYKMLNLVAPTKEDCEMWVTGLHMLLSQADGATFQTNMRTWLRRMWKEVDTTGRDRLNLDEVAVLMKRLNVRLSKVEIKSTFKQADISKQGYISYNNFERLYRALRFRPEIAELFSSLAKANAPFLIYEEFETFVLDIQKANWTPARCMEVYKKYCQSDADMMDLEHFSAFLISANNALFRKAHTDVHQDMSRPMNDYFINSSHNTYLLGDQLTSESSVEGYIRALQRGCRCLELDCFDGPNGPLIYHKHSLTGRILFRDAIEAISRYAFVTSPYPLILSLELHCTIEQQNVMVAIMQELFGEYLLIRSLNELETQLPSPESLKYRILVKAKLKVASAGDESEYETEEEEGDPAWDATFQREPPPKHGAPESQMSPVLRRPRAFSRRNVAYIGPLSSSYPQLHPDPSMAIAAYSPPAEEGLSQSASSHASLSPALSANNVFSNATAGMVGGPNIGSALPRRKSFNDELKKKTSPPLGKRKLNISKNLSDIVVYCKGIRFEGISSLRGLAFNEMFSISESKALPFIARHRDDIAVFSSTHLSRVYPAPMRVNSSNFDPTVFWSTGIQMVAMNFQTFDRGLQINRALFSGNGKCGFILKPSLPAHLSPPSLSEQDLSNGSPPEKSEGSTLGRVSVGSGRKTARALTVYLISAHQLPKAREENDGTVLDPFVDIEVFSPDSETVRYRTKPINGNGFNPTWKETFRFPITNNPLTFVRFQVSDGDAKLTNDVIGTYTILLSNMELGYRHVPLLNRRGEVIRFSTLFMYIELS